ncbi:unnamed protein product [Protopolystoma xenopodis]|uniref:Uncharacterized protein n=1 Tax=Protopolystoma xenopodis TaxID=117903 RepID=A0A3S5A8W3_9PLAT|nr:unnamed protein product [Protopolystoma xenopodis]
MCPFWPVYCGIITCCMPCLPSISSCRSASNLYSDLPHGSTDPTDFIRLQTLCIICSISYFSSFQRHVQSRLTCRAHNL